MAQFILCTLCDCGLEIAEFDLQTSFASYSKTSLLVLLQNCIAEEFFITNYIICKMCYLLLNELDNFQTKIKAIKEKLKSYMCKYYINNKIYKCEQTELNSNEFEECSVCCKKINCKDFKNHIKVQHPELNCLETSFNFDDVNSISEINPSLEDIHLLSAVESTERNNTKIKTNDGRKKNGKQLKRKDSNNPKPFKCLQCLKTWKTSAELKNHMSSHNKERPYICEICGQAYKRQHALTIHVGMHKGINPFTCVYCNKSFTQKGGLVRHTPIHTGELPFQCDLCGKRFAHHTSFNMHKLSHTGQKSYKCEVCGLLLMSGSHLKRHLRVHTGEKKFTCGTCGKKFAEKYNLAVHEKLHLGLSKKKKFQKAPSNQGYFTAEGSDGVRKADC